MNDEGPDDIDSALEMLGYLLIVVVCAALTFVWWAFA